jgi:hypothetical protein
MCPIAVKDAAQCRDLHREVGFLDGYSWPDDPEDFIFRDQLALPLDEKAKLGERTRTERDWFGGARATRSKQTATGTIEAKAFEQESVRRTEPVHALVPRQFWDRPNARTWGAFHCVRPFQIVRLATSDGSRCLAIRAIRYGLFNHINAPPVWIFLQKFGIFWTDLIAPPPPGAANFERSNRPSRPLGPFADSKYTGKESSR